ncbi:MAG: (Fe-S)-binding protein [Chitinophagales bacterium]|nr:(Fe-S)-binding protein [Chitinophagales bacterium]MDW8419551.1 (Fe-S)-binding protein [Chitinophagales bacterium]
MAKYFQIYLFVLLTAIAFYFAYRGYRRVYQNICLGKPEDLTDQPLQRWKNMLLVAFGQKKMFKNVIPAVLHLFLYVGFLITQVELLEVFLDGITGSHRIIYHAVENLPVLRTLYVGLISSIEIASVLVFIGTVAFLWRRFVLKVPRLNKPELKGFPIQDAATILIAEIYLLICIFSMNTADMALHEGKYGFAVSSVLQNLFHNWSHTSLTIMERIGWWGHYIGVLGFLVYLPYSKHLHILLAFPNTYFARLTPKGYVNNMPEITREIKLMMDPSATPPPADPNAPPPRFGAKDVMDLSWKNLLDAYTCTECGRCTAACPANMTGKKLSPRKIMMDTRDRLEEVGAAIAANGGVWKDDGKSLIENGYITIEELRACTTCNACVEECPVMISPLDIILQLRRNLIMEESNAPAEWTSMFTNMENNGAPWQFSQQDRLNWANA